MNKKLKIYLAGPIRAVNQKSNVIGELRKFLPRYGEVLTENIGWDSPGQYYLAECEIYERDINMLNEADIMIAECSSPSHGVGYELGYALHIRKIPVIILRSKEAVGKLSAMLLGNPDLDGYIIEYGDENSLLVDLDVMVTHVLSIIELKKRRQEMCDEFDR
jgi:nucleoside 2-deoxyribosyltransferase